MTGEWSPPDEFEEYRLVRLLGRGAMGMVYLAHDTLLDRAVAVKFVRAAEDPAARERFFLEARAIAKLQHPNVVAIYRVAEIARHPYLVSEYVRGRALDTLERPVAWQQVLALALDLTRGLAAAHRGGVLHRDVKPANAVLAEDGRAKLLDFGLAIVVEPTTDSIARRDASPPPTPPSADATVSIAGRVAPSDVAGDRRAHDAWAGTPLYMAPEVWRGEPATARSDLYSLGILLYELLAGTAPHRGVPVEDLGRAIQERPVTPLAEVARDIEPDLAAIVDRLIDRDAGARFASADALLVALEECDAPTSEDGVPDGNPYRGLSAFQSTHRSVFFGRRTEIRELVDRLATEPMIVVGGDSGVGKSSLCRAGVLPWLADNDGWSYVDVVPGRQPVRALAAALAAWTGVDEATLASQLCEAPDDVARMIRRHTAERRLLLFVDQIEELLTLASPVDAQIIAVALAALAVRAPSVRVLATARSDFLTRLAVLPYLGDELMRGLYLLRPLAGERVREAIVRPAAAKGVVFESDALVATLVEQAENAPGGLPLLQFTLAQLWDARDVEAKMVRTVSLTALGGVEGALTRHADALLAGLHGSARDAARRILLRLVTTEGTRGLRSETELLSGDAGPERAALEALVRGRLVVANDAQDGGYEIAHEALIANWTTLQDWLQHGASARALLHRIEHAAAEWDRLGRARDVLWGRRQISEVAALDHERLGPREVAFVRASRAALLRRRAVVAGSAAVIVAGVVAVGFVVRDNARRELAALVADHTRSAATAIDEARAIAMARDAARSVAFALFDDHHWSEAEDEWSRVEQLAAREDGLYRDASNQLETGLSLDPTNAGVRARLADALFERLLRAQRDHRLDVVQELSGRLSAYDDRRHDAALGAPARIDVDVTPPGTQIWSERAIPGAAAAPDARQLLAQAPAAALAVPAGSLILAFEAPGRVAARFPVLLDSGETLRVRVTLPETRTAPPGMIYVPPGRFLFGSADGSDLRRGFLNAPPIHEITTPGYFIARHEVTFGEWIEFLEQLPVDERHRRTPGITSPQSSLTLTAVQPTRWRLELTPTTRTYAAETGERLRYVGRTLRAEQDWTRFPVSAVSFEDSVAFAEWLDRTGRVPGARLCDEYEWERAARGADGRTFPSGDRLAPDDANVDVTYGREPLGFGPDEVGSHPGSRSPVGVDDLAGNVWEWTRSVQTPGAPVARGGGWYNAQLSARSMNREYGEPTQRHPLIGLRVCATPR